MTDTKPTVDSAFLFSELTKRLNKHPMDVQQRITAHVRAKSGHNTIPSFIGNGSTEEMKVEVLKDCLNALLRNDFSALLGSVPAGQASSPVEAVETAIKAKLGVDKLPSNIIVAGVGFDKPKVNPLPNRDSILPSVPNPAPTPPPKPAPVPVPKILAVAEPPAAAVQRVPVSGDKVAEAVAALTEALAAASSAPSGASLNPEFVADLVRKEVKQCLDGFYKDMVSEVQKAVNQLKCEMVDYIGKEVKSWREDIAERLTKEEK